MAKQKIINRKPLVIIICLIVVVVVVIGLTTGRPTKGSAKNGIIQVVAAENFWGSLASQLGGVHAHVTSIVSDPNADPHEYESNASTARSFASADFVILNGAGYDNWGNKLLSANPNPARRVLVVADLLGKKNGDNPHFWYDPADVNQVVAQIEQDYIAIEPADKAYFQQQYRHLQASLSGYQSLIVSIKKQFAGTKVAATESIFQYLAAAAGLDLVSPPAFTEAVAEGNDPPTNSVVTFQQQLKSNQVKLLVFNEQTVTPLTDSMKQLAAAQSIPVVGITETIQPPNTSFQLWMSAEVNKLEKALNANVPG
jgi:zinc/manganese transport system substrate-binding protein